MVKKRLFRSFLAGVCVVLCAVPSALPRAVAEDDYPTASESGAIHSVNFSWVDNSSGDWLDESTITMRTNSLQTNQARLDFRTTADASYGIGALTVEVPYRVWKDRYGKETGYVVLDGVPLKGSVPSGATNYVYSVDEERGVLIFENNRPINGEVHSVLSFALTVGSKNGSSTNVDLHNYVDNTASEPIRAHIRLTGSDGQEVDSYTSRTLTAHLNTYANYLFYLRGEVKRQADSSLGGYFYAYGGEYTSESSQRAYSEYLTWRFDDDSPDNLSYSSSPVINLTRQAVIGDVEEVSGQRVRIDIASDKRSVNVRCVDEADEDALCEKPLLLKVNVSVPASALPTSNEYTVAVQGHAETNFIPIDGFDAPYVRDDTTYLGYTYKASEELDKRYSSTTFGLSATTYKTWAEDNPNARFLFSEYEDGEDLIWHEKFFGGGSGLQVVTRGALPILESIDNDGQVWTAHVTNPASYPSRLSTLEIPLPDGVDIDEESLIFTLNNQEVQAHYSLNDGILNVSVPSMDSKARFDVTFTTSGDTLSGKAGALTTAYEGFAMSKELGERYEKRTDTFTVTNNGDAPSPAGIPLELNRLGDLHDINMFPTNITYRTLVNGQEISVSSERSVRGYSYAIYLPELEPGDVFTVEVSKRQGVNYDKQASASLLASAGHFRTKLGVTSVVNGQKNIAASTYLYGLISDIRSETQTPTEHLYAMRPIVQEIVTKNIYVKADRNSNKNRQTLIPGTDFTIPYVSLERPSISPVDSHAKEPHTSTLWGRSEMDTGPWVKLAEVTYEQHYVSGSGWQWWVGDIQYANGAYDHSQLGAYPQNPGKVLIGLPEGIVQLRSTQTYNHVTGFSGIGFHPQIRLNADHSEAVQAAIDDVPNYSWNQLVFQHEVEGYWYYEEDADPETFDIPNNLLYKAKQYAETVLSKSPVMYANQEASMGSTLTSVRNKEQTMFTLTNKAQFTVSHPQKTASIDDQFGASCVYSQKIESGEWKHVTHGKFYSLQAPGVRVDKNSLTLKTLNPEKTTGTWIDSEGEIVDVQLIENWRGSGRQMLIVEVDNLPYYDPPANCHRDVAQNGTTYVDFGQITFTSYYSIEDYLVYGSRLSSRLDAFENLSDNKIGYRSTNPDWAAGRLDTIPTSWDAMYKPWFNNLNATVNENPTFLYSSTSPSVSATPQILSDFTKTVSSNGQPNYSGQAWVAPGDSYSYSLRLFNNKANDETGIVLFDSIETYQPEEAEPRAHFRGKLTGLNLAALRFQGIEPVVYYSTVKDLDVRAHSDIHDEQVWRRAENPDTFEGVDLESVTAFAIDCSFAADGQPFILPPDKLLLAEIYMKAPSAEEARAQGNLSVKNPVAYVYNDTYATAFTIDDYAVRTPITNHYAYTTLALHDPTIVLKAGKALTGRALAAGQFSFGVWDETGEKVAHGVNDADGTITFSPISYTVDDVGTHTYTLREDSDYVSPKGSCAEDAYTCDTHEYTVTVDVIETGGGVTAIAHYPDGLEYSSADSPYLPEISAPNTVDASRVPAFINRYTSAGSSPDIAARKEVDVPGLGNSAPALRDGQFSFAIFDENGSEVATATNNKDGEINFGTLTFTEKDVDPQSGRGHKEYTIREIGQCEAFWICDTHSEKLVLDLVDDAHGAISVDVSYDDDGAVFTNTYSEPPATWLENAAQHNWVILAFAFLGGLMSLGLMVSFRRR